MDTSDEGQPPARHYVLACTSCGRRQADDGLILECPSEHAPALLRTEYADRRFNPRSGWGGLFRYRDWLPVVRVRESAGRTVVFRSKGLARELGLRHLWVAFNGYWPEREAALETGTFKELEAYTVLGRLPERQVLLTVASSGNTAAAFAWACSRERIPCLLVVPGKGLRRFRFSRPLDPCVNLVAIEDGDYPDAIELVAAVSRAYPCYVEGGVKNVGRRDGLATVLLSAFEEMRCLPSHYFQAVGSGTGAIAVLEAANRVRDAMGDPDAALPKLMMCQNRPFTPIYDAWARNLPLGDGASTRYRQAIKHVYADELTNWAPPYEIGGGVRDALAESRGEVLTADNVSVRLAMNMFAELEGIDIEPAAAVALACLRDAVAGGRVGKEAVVLLNITGGGRGRLGRDHALVPAQPQLRLSTGSLATGEAVDRTAALLPRTLAGAES